MFVRRESRGSIAPRMAAAIVLVGLLMIGLGRLGQGAADRSRAQTAADAAALAGAAEGERAAHQVAQANGAQVLRYEVSGDDTRVVVEVGVAEASAKARRGPPPPRP